MDEIFKNIIPGIVRMVNDAKDLPDKIRLLQITQSYLQNLQSYVQGELAKHLQQNDAIIDALAETVVKVKVIPSDAVKESAKTEKKAL